MVHEGVIVAITLLAMGFAAGYAVRASMSRRRRFRHL